MHCKCNELFPLHGTCNGAAVQFSVQMRLVLSGFFTLIRFICMFLWLASAVSSSPLPLEKMIKDAFSRH